MKKTILFLTFLAAFPLVADVYAYGCTTDSQIVSDAKRIEQLVRSFNQLMNAGSRPVYTSSYAQIDVDSTSLVAAAQSVVAAVEETGANSQQTRCAISNLDNQLTLLEQGLIGVQYTFYRSDIINRFNQVKSAHVQMTTAMGEVC